MKHKEKNLASIKAKNFFKNNWLLFLFLGILVTLGALVYFASAKENKQEIFGDDVVDMYYFHLSTCPHCHKQNEYNKILKEKYPMLRIHEYEITSTESQQKYKELAANYENVDNTRISTPTTFIGNQSNVGYGSDDTTGVKLEEMIEAELERINSNWDDETMIRTLDLREQYGIK